MDDAINLTLSLGGVLYCGQFRQWRDYARVLVAGKITSYKQSAACRNQSLTAFFQLFRGLWSTKKAPLPAPERFGLIPLRPENMAQDEIIDALGRVNTI